MFNAKKRGFTLVELLIVIVVIGILFVVVVANVDFTSDTAKEVGVQSTFKSYQVACQTVGTQYSGFTSDVNTLVNYLNKRLDSELQLYTDDSGNIKSFAVDPWGTSIKVEYSEPENSKGQLRFISAGPDTIFYTNDDIITQIKCTIDNDILIENPVNDINHSHNYNQQVATSYYQKSAANCENPATYYLSCTCGEKSTTTFTKGEINPNVHEVVMDTFVALANNKHMTTRTCQSCYTVIEEVEEEHDTTEGTICPICGSPVHTHIFDQNIQTDKHKVNDADCNRPLTYYYSCTCGETGTNTFTVGNPIAHDFNEKTTNYKYLDATCSAPAKYYYTCLTCHTVSDQTFDYGVEDETNHVGVEITTYQSINNTQHTKIVKCSGCNGQKSAIDENHNPTVGTCTLCNNHTHSFTQESTDEKFEFKKAACKSKALYFYSCACGEAGSETFEFGEINNNHIGALVNANRADACQTWDCCNKVETTHVYNQQVVADKYIAIEATCTSLPKYYKSCNCGFYLDTNETFESGTVDPDGHTKGIITAATSTVCQKYECCELEVSTTHTMSITGIESVHSTCTICGYKNTTHSYTTTYKTISGVTVNGNATKTCSCGYTYNEIKKLTNYTWNEIKILADANLTAKQYKDTFGIELGQKKDNTYILVDFDGNSYDGFIFMYNSNTTNAIYSTGSSYGNNQGGYASANTIKTHINNLYQNLSNTELKSVIKQVVITCNSGDKNADGIDDNGMSIYKYNCYMFLPSAKEVGFNLSGYRYAAEGEGFEYLVNGSRRQEICSTSSWWLRTAYSQDTSYFYYVKFNGSYLSASSSTSQRIIPCFVVGSECSVYKTEHQLNEVVDNLYLKSSATCSTQAVYYQSCECGFYDTNKTFAYGSSLVHVPNKDLSTAYCTDEVICTVCSTVIKEALDGHEEYAHGYCIIPESCSACGWEGENYGDHIIEGVFCDSLAENRHYERCAVCGENINSFEYIHELDYFEDRTHEGNCQIEACDTYICNADFHPELVIYKGLNNNKHVDLNVNEASCSVPIQCYACGWVSTEYGDHESNGEYYYSSENNYHFSYCFHCMEPMIHETQQIIELIPSTCTSYGTLTYSCDICGTKTIDLGIDPDNHIDGWLASCNEQRICNDCNEQYGPVIGCQPDDENYWFYNPEYDANIHYQVCWCCCSILNETYFEHEIIETIEPTCINEGSVTYDCEVCGYGVTRVLPIDSNNHVDYWNPDCTAPYICHDCGESFGEVVGCQPMEGWYYDDINDIHYQECWCCGSRLNETYIKHSIVEEIEATCGRNGTITYYCDICDFVEVETPMLSEHTDYYESDCCAPERCIECGWVGEFDGEHREGSNGECTGCGGEFCPHGTFIGYGEGFCDDCYNASVCPNCGNLYYECTCNGSDCSHSFDDNSCSCLYCGETFHNFSDAPYGCGAGSCYTCVKCGTSSSIEVPHYGDDNGDGNCDYCGNSI